MIDTTRTFQRFAAWEAHVEAGFLRPDFNRYVDSLVARNIEELGITRIRLEVRSGAEAAADHYSAMRARGGFDEVWRCRRYPTVNDDDDPRHINPAGFHFSELDTMVTRVVLPARAVARARGDSLAVTLTYVAFARQLCPGFAYLHDDPEEYAEFMLAAVLHLRARWGLVPDLIEPILEPDLDTRFRDGEHVGRSMVAAAARLRAAGFAPRFIAPSTTSLAAAATWFDGIRRVPGAGALVAELTYHRYRGVSTGALRALAARAATAGIGTAMLEHIGADQHELLQDLTIGGVVAWQQFTLGAPVPNDRGGSYYIVDSAYRPVQASRTRYLWNYMRFIRPGAVRVAAAAGAGVEPVAFRRPEGGFVAVANVPRAVTLEVRGLPAGAWRAVATHAGTRADTIVRTAGDGTLTVRVVAAGVVTVLPAP